MGLRSRKFPGHFGTGIPFLLTTSYEFGSVCRGIILHKMSGLVNAPKRQPVIVQHFEIVGFFIVTFLVKKYNPLLLCVLLNAPQTNYTI